MQILQYSVFFRNFAGIITGIVSLRGANPPLNRHCGLDPQSPEQNRNLFSLRRWRMFLRHDDLGGEPRSPFNDYDNKKSKINNEKSRSQEL
jgi:hypothetical protein